MSELTLTKLRFRNGVWEGRVTGVDGTAPDIRVMYLDQPVKDVELKEEDGTWTLFVPVPAQAIADGVHSFLIVDATNDTRLGDFTVLAGETMADDLRAEVELLRAELDMLKRAFRRHCLETM